MLRPKTLIRTLAAAVVIAALFVPSAFADPNPSNPPVYWSYDYQAPIPHPKTASRVVKVDDNDAPWKAISAGLAGVCLLLGAATVLPRRTRPRTAV
jgi:hypothetical protein